LRKDKGKKRKAAISKSDKVEQAKVEVTKKNNAIQSATRPIPSTSKGKTLAGQPTLHAFVAMSRTFSDGIELSPEQKAVLGEIALKKSVFLTGAAG
jgi:hypothetical protein